MSAATNADDLGDIRDIDAKTAASAPVQDVALAQDIRLIGDAPRSHTRGKQVAQYNSLHIMPMVLRYVNRFLAPEWRWAATNPDKTLGARIEQEEKDNPLLRIAWSRFNASLDNMKTLQSALESIRLRTKTQPGDLLDMLESDDMLQTFWAREPFLLHHRVVLVQPIKEPVEGQWRSTTTELVPIKERAQKSLLRWSPGAGTLADFIEKQFGLFEDDDVAQRYLYRFNQPAVLRVHSRVTKTTFATPDEARARHSFEALRELDIDGSAWLPNADGTMIVSDGSNKTKYALVMVVRLHDYSHAGKILLRRYHPAGNFIDEPDHFEYRDKTWKLSDSVGSYLLYYCRCLDTSLPAPATLREMPKNDGFGRDETADRQHMERVFRMYNPAGPR
ncbi:hypothetical protein PG987_007538 [Apiospora arundinis]